MPHIDKYMNLPISHHNEASEYTTQYSSNNEKTMTILMNPSKQWSYTEQIPPVGSNKMAVKLSQIMKQLSRKMCRQLLLPSEYTELKSVPQLEKSLNVARSISNRVLYAKFNRSNQPEEQKKRKNLKEEAYENSDDNIDENIIDEYQYKDFGYGQGDKEGERREFILSVMNKHSPRKHLYGSLPRKTAAYAQSRTQNVGTQIASKHKSFNAGKQSPPSEHLLLSTYAPEFIGSPTGQHLQEDLNQMLNQLISNEPNKLNNNVSAQSNDVIENITSFNMTDYPLMMDLMENQKGLYNSTSIHKDSACESDNLSTLTDELYSFKNSFEFLESTSHQTLPKITTNDSMFSSATWQKFMELWNRSINDERVFWQKQLLERTKFNYNYHNDEAIDVKSLLNDVSRFHTEELRLLWKQIYESWVPRDYLQYFSDETRKVFVNLNLVIEKLLSFIEQNSSDSTSPNPINLQSDLKCSLTKYMHARLEDQKQPQQTTRCTGHNLNLGLNKRLSNSCSSIDKIKNVAEVSKTQSSVHEDHRINFNKMREILKMSHQQLLEQIYHVTEMVGAALDTDMEDVINGVDLAGSENKNDNGRGNFDARSPMAADMLTSPSAPGLQVVAKLHSAILDLETRLDTMCNNPIIAENITNSIVECSLNQGNKNIVNHESYASDRYQKLNGCCTTDLLDIIMTSGSNIHNAEGAQIDDLQNTQLMNVTGDDVNIKNHISEGISSVPPVK
ncbi:unnamed protein product [Trichobilharzia szidati]|nr:unnamed protein product [Trichobilharzia szidati]